MRHKGGVAPLVATAAPIVAPMLIDAALNKNSNNDE